MNEAINEAAAKTLMYPLSELDDWELEAVPPPPQAAREHAIVLYNLGMESTIPRDRASEEKRKT